MKKSRVPARALGLFALILGAAFISCSSPTSSKASTTGTTTTTSTTVSAPTTLFSDSGLTFTNSSSPTNQLLMVQDMGDSTKTATTAVTSPIPATGTFNAYPANWDGALAWATLPTGAAGYYDLSKVATIKFKIKSANILPTQLAFFIQWKSGTSGNGNEFTVPLSYSSSVTDPSTAASGLGVTSITDWTEVSMPISDIVDLASNKTSGSLYTGEPTRYSYTAEPWSMSSGDGATHVDTPFAIKWYGSAGTSSNTGPLTSGSYQIGDIQFLDSSGNNVSIATGITWPVITKPTTVTSSPTVASGSVVSLFNSSGTYTNVAMTDWQASWSVGGTMANDSTSVSGKTLLKLAFSTTTGFDGADIASVQNISALTKRLHIDYWTPDGVGFQVKVVDFAPSGAYDATNNQTGIYSITPTQNGWQSVNIDLTSPSSGSLTDYQYIAQLVFVATGSNATQNYWIDNIYFY